MLANARKCLEFSIQDEIESDTARASEAKRLTLHLRAAAERLSTEEAATHDWLNRQLDRRPADGFALTAQQWTHAKVRYAEAVISDTVLKAFRTAELYAPRLRDDPRLIEAVTLLNIMHDRLLGTDAMMERPKVRYSISMLTRHLGARLGPMVGNAINAKRHPAEIFAHMALVFAADIWRLWADADHDPSAEYENQSPTNWWRFTIQHALCSMACDGAQFSRNAESHPERMVRWQAALADEFDGGEVPSVLETAWTLAKSEDLSTFSGERRKWSDVFYYESQLRTVWAHAEFIRAVLMTFRHGSKKPIPPPRWAGNFSERVYWRTAGDELWQKEFGHLFK